MSDEGRDLVEIGRLGKPHGVRGEIKVLPTIRDGGQVSDLQRVFSGTEASVASPMVVESIREQHTARGLTLLFKFTGFDDRDAVTSLRGRRLYAQRSDLPDPGTQGLLYGDLVGCNVLDSGQNSVGVISDILERPPQDLVQIQLASGRAILVPLVDEFFLDIDIENRRVTVDLLEGFETWP